MNNTARIVLVVEDEPLIRLFLADALEDAGYAVLEAGCVLEAVGILGMRSDIDAIFTDVDMPGGLSGIELAHMVAGVSAGTGIVVTSGRADICAAQLPQRAVFVPKPYSEMLAARSVEQAMERTARTALPQRAAEM